ncbi:MAG: glycosyltransferase family 1 protein [Patescibacteria group bacterium]|nr:glycosyltransferase family 1 protein [Patescibacteria group bacterium]
MIIGINATAAFIEPRTGVEEYTAQLIKHLTILEESAKHRFLLYSPFNKEFDFHLPTNFKIKRLKWGLPAWTQMRLSAEMAVNRPDILFIPVHVLPLIHPQNSIAVIHGLEYEYEPKMYPRRHLKYLRWSAKYALKNAARIIAISENTKNDLIKIYGANPEKISVVHHGYAGLRHCEKRSDAAISSEFIETTGLPRFARNDSVGSAEVQPPKYILFIGRLEMKKNIGGLVEAFNLFKKTYGLPHKLLLAGKRGYSYNTFADELARNEDIIEMGYVDEDEKWRLLKNAALFAFPVLYEGFGMPILEAQAAGCPVISSGISSLPEVAGEGAAFVSPKNIEQTAEMMYKIISDKELKDDLIEKGFQNIKRFSWEKCARETLKILTNSNSKAALSIKIQGQPFQKTKI